MEEFVPDILVYGKILAKIQDMRYRFSSEADAANTFQGALSEIEAAVSEVLNTDDMPIATFERFVKGEPPNLDKMNILFSRFENDFALLESQSAILRASTIFQFNQIATNLAMNRNLNAQARDRLAVLQLYTNAVDSGTTFFGSSLSNDSEFDKSFVPASLRPSLVSPGNLVLGLTKSSVDLTQTASIKILEGSNGYPGNNQEVDSITEEVSSTAVGDETSDDGAEVPVIVDYRLVRNIFNPKYAETILDGNSDTWFEFEAYEVPEADKALAENYGFTYGPKSGNDELKVGGGPGTVNAYGYLNGESVKWSDGTTDDSGVLKLGLEVSFPTVKQINSIGLFAHGLTDNVNEPIKIVNVRVSEDGSNWTTLTEENVWIAYNASKAIARLAPNVSIGSHTWVFPKADVKYVRFMIHQSKGIQVDVGHPYYTEKDTVEEEIDEATGERTTKIIEGERIEGPIPPINEAEKYDGPIDSVLNSKYVRKFEKFNGQRLAIGLRDISMQFNEYAVISEFYSKTYKIDGLVNRVALEADYRLPADFPDTKQWIRFYVSPDNGLSWFQISRIEDNFLGIPEIIAFNDPIPEDYRDPNVAYYDVDGFIDSVKLKVELERPDNLKSQTPILKSYNLKVQKL